MSETPDIGADESQDLDAEFPDTLPDEAPEADVIEQARDVRPDPGTAGDLQGSRPDPAIDEANEADRQEQAEVVAFDEDDETR